MALQGWTVGRVIIDGAAEAVVLDRNHDSPGRARAIGKTNRNVNGLLARGTARVCRIGDDHDLVRVDAGRIRTGATRWVAVVIEDLVGAATAHAHIKTAGGATAVGCAGHVRLIPLHDDRYEIARREAGDCHRQVRGVCRSRGIEVQQVFIGAALKRDERRRGVLICERAVIAGGGKVGHTLRPHGIDGLRDDSVLEERFVKVAHVVANDGGPGVGERTDAGGEVRFAVVRRAERERCAGGDVVHDLQHRTAFVGERQLLRLTVIQAVGVFENVDVRRKIAGRNVGGVIRRKAVLRVTIRTGSRNAISRNSIDRIAIETVGEHADGDAGAGQSIIGAQHVTALRKVALARDRARARARHCGAQRNDFAACGGGLQLIDRQPATDVIGEARCVLQSERNERRLELFGIAAGGGVDEDQRSRAGAMLGKARGGTQRVQIGQHMIRPRPRGMTHKIGEYRVKLGGTTAAPLLGTARPHHVEMSAARSRI